MCPVLLGLPHQLPQQRVLTARIEYQECPGPPDLCVLGREEGGAGEEGAVVTTQLPQQRVLSAGRGNTGQPGDKMSQCT